MTFDIGREYTVLDEGYGYELIKNGVIEDVVAYSDKIRIYNRFVDILSEITDIKADEKSLLIFGKIYIEKGILDISNNECGIDIAGHVFTPEWKNAEQDVTVGDKTYSGRSFELLIPTEEVLDFGAISPVVVFIKDQNGFGCRKNLKWDNWEKALPLSGSYEDTAPKASASSHPRPDLSAYLRQTTLNNVYMTVNQPNVIDSPEEDAKMYRAYKEAMQKRAEGGQGAVLMFEKKGQKYEESGSIVFEKLIDNRFEEMKPVYFVLAKDSIYWDRVPEKYRPYLVEQFSYKHYFLFFYADVFIGSELIQHSIEYFVKNPLARAKILEDNFRFVYLRHGVGYLKGLTPDDSPFIKGKGFPRYGRVVVCSETEASHMIKYANMDMRNFYITGFSKFDRAKRDETHDLIVIMLTYRKWEVNMYEDDPCGTSYYRDVLKAYESVPDELKEKTVVLTHPLLMGKFDNTPLGKHILTDVSYDDILRRTELLITDWSSISYDAFYRGAKVIFDWEGREEYYKAKPGNHLMLNDDNVFADVCYSSEDMPALIKKNYYGEQTPEQIERFRDIVKYHDEHNADRLFEALKRDGYLSKPEPVDLADCEIVGITKKLYTGHPLTLAGLDVFHGTRQLVEGTDYEVEYSDNIEAGSATVTVKGIGENTGEKKEQFLIRYSSALFEVGGLEDRVYTGGKITQQLTCTFRGELLEEGTDYKLTYENNKNTGIASVNILGRQRFGGKKTLRFRIKPADINSCEITGITKKLYTGEPLTLRTLELTFAGKKLAEGSDYTVWYKDNVEPGLATVTVKGTGNFCGEYSEQFLIRYNSTMFDVEGLSDCTYTGAKITQELRCFFRGELLEEEKDYKITYENNKDAGTATVSILGRGDRFGGKKILSFGIKPADINSCEITGITKKLYTGEPLTLRTLELTFAGKKLAEGSDYTVWYKDNVEPGLATVTVKGAGNFCGEYSEQFLIRYNSSMFDVEGLSDCTYTGAKITQELRCFFRGELLEEGTDYKLTYENNKNTGIASVNILGRQRFGGKKILSFGIKPADINSCEITGITKKLYTGEPLTLRTLELIFADKKLAEGSDYTVWYKDNVEPGLATVTVKGTGNFCGEYSEQFLIRYNSSMFDVEGLTDCIYNGKPRKQKLTCTFRGEVLEENTDYKVTYENNTGIGTATVNILGRGDRFGGKLTLTFLIKPDPRLLKAFEEEENDDFDEDDEDDDLLDESEKYAKEDNHEQEDDEDEDEDDLDDDEEE